MEGARPVFGVAFLAFGVINMLNSEGGGGALLVLWWLAGVVIIGVNLWAAFARHGSLATFERDDHPCR